MAKERKRRQTSNNNNNNHNQCNAKSFNHNQPLRQPLKQNDVLELEEVGKKKETSGRENVTRRDPPQERTRSGVLPGGLLQVFRHSSAFAERFLSRIERPRLERSGSSRSRKDRGISPQSPSFSSLDHCSRLSSDSSDGFARFFPPSSSDDIDSPPSPQTKLSEELSS